MRPSFLLITVDDMNYNSREFLKDGAMPLFRNLDSLQEESILFSNSHVAIAVCQPSRSVLLTGRYPHRNGARGFERIDDAVITLTKILREHGYFNGIIGKETHLEPKEKFAWDDYRRTYDEAHGYGRRPSVYYESVWEFLHLAGDRPFFLMANSHDPHRPFAGSEDEIKFFGHHTEASHTYSPDDVIVPDFLPDLPEIRRELAQYLTSVRRADETVGEILRALRESGREGDTVVFFLSDNGMAMPFCKANCYLNSTKSPCLLRCPWKFPRGGTVDTLVNSIDFMPTMLDLAEIDAPEDLDGESWLPLIDGGAESHANGSGTNRETQDIFTLFFKTAKNQITKRERHYPMRCVQDLKYAYIFNAWSDGETAYRTESMAGLTYQAMKEAAEADPAVAARVDLLEHRVPEELYCYAEDPGALHNLIGEPEHRERLSHFRGRMKSYMERTGDELLPVFCDFLQSEASDS